MSHLHWWYCHFLTAIDQWIFVVVTISELCQKGMRFVDCAVLQVSYVPLLKKMLESSRACIFQGFIPAIGDDSIWGESISSVQHKTSNQNVIAMWMDHKHSRWQVNTISLKKSELRLLWNKRIQIVVWFCEMYFLCNQNLFHVNTSIWNSLSKIKDVVNWEAWTIQSRGLPNKIVKFIQNLNKEDGRSIWVIFWCK